MDEFDDELDARRKRIGESEMRTWVVIGIVLIAIAAIPLPNESAFQRVFDVLNAAFWGFAIATDLEEARAEKRWVR